PTSYVKAIAIVLGALDHGWEVPKDIQVVSFNNTRLVELVRPQLSSVIQSLFDISAVAMRLLCKYMNTLDIVNPNVILPHKLKYRSITRQS
ncbi:catabolite control protein A, partial [Staphylococcus pseudintermedius]|uniref:substrate-binding domain-containing protein n=1 Tax=Staphylococcus pseudintermedius TaxID=283734 RepID=UPI000E375707